MEGKSDWEQMFVNLSDDHRSLFDSSLLSDLSNPSPDSYSLSIGDIEQLLMEDDNEDGRGEEAVVGQLQALEWPNDFLSDFLLDSPVESDPSDEVVDLPDGGKNSNSSPSSEEEHDGMDVLPQTENNGEGVEPVSKKRQRQLRNRDAAVRSRERKKMYVRDLEMKSKYLEGECRRLGILLQCCYAENQALRLSVQNTKAFDASMTKQESAVLLLELGKGYLPLNTVVSVSTCGRIPAVGFPALVPGHRLPAHSARPAPVDCGSSSTRKRRQEKSGKSGYKKGRK
ncbi:basic region/leucine zipper motif 60 [Actinidia rufa]|uniref:Basic region/leucine zipper motif 60 n=1 Tax=Actinidia rufa TaxID=165716 RepID=A0A7J0GIF5_9ERIC|nr:basic region/leucine zipper motif 60 [Actinidia rufa]